MRLSEVSNLSLLEFITFVTNFLGTWWRLDTKSCPEKTLKPLEGDWEIVYEKKRYVGDGAIIR